MGERSDSAKLREYRAIVWTRDATRPGERVTLLAATLEDARQQIEARFGPDITCSLWNEDDANRIR